MPWQGVFVCPIKCVPSQGSQYANTQNCIKQAAKNYPKSEIKIQVSLHHFHFFTCILFDVENEIFEMGEQILRESTSFFYILTVSRLGFGKTLWTGEWPLWPPLVLQLWGHQKPKKEPWHIFGTKSNIKSHFGQFQVSQLSSQRTANFKR